MIGSLVSEYTHYLESDMTEKALATILIVALCWNSAFTGPSYSRRQMPIDKWYDWKSSPMKQLSSRAERVVCAGQCSKEQDFDCNVFAIIDNGTCSLSRVRCRWSMCRGIGRALSHRSDSTSSQALRCSSCSRSGPGAPPPRSTHQ